MKRNNVKKDIIQQIELSDYKKIKILAQNDSVVLDIIVFGRTETFVFSLDEFDDFAEVIKRMERKIDEDTARFK